MTKSLLVVKLVTILVPVLMLVVVVAVAVMSVVVGIVGRWWRWQQRRVYSQCLLVQ
jgi:hypothetical protein